MTPTALYPPTDRKDVSALISHQPDAPCLLDGYEGESFMAFLMRLYAYFVAQFTREIELEYSPITYTCEGSAKLKAGLLTSGPYHMSSMALYYHARPDALRLMPLWRDVTGEVTEGWIVLWPGAKRDHYIETGRSVPVFDKATARITPVAPSGVGVNIVAKMFFCERIRHQVCGLITTDADTTAGRILIPP